ncbi:MAG: isoprenylcysteine carboxylmethyltransferase family protein [Gemmatimonadaceae bacterium]
MNEDSIRIRPAMRFPVPWVFILAYLIGLVAELFVPVGIASPVFSRIGFPAGLCLVAVGMAFALSALAIFRKRSTTTIPHAKPTSLATSGPYRFTRNPMYVGLTLIYIGVAGTRAEIWPLILLPLVLVYVNFVVIPFEERRMQDVFGDDCGSYRTRVRSWL